MFDHCLELLSQEILLTSNIYSSFNFIFKFLTSFFLIFLIRNSKSHTRSVFIPKNDDEILGTFILEILDPPRLYSSLNYAYYPTMLTKKFTFESNSNKIEHNNYKNNNNNHNHNNKDNINNSIKKSYDKESQQQQQQALRLSILDSNDSLTQYETHHLIKEEIESESIDKSDVFKPFGISFILF